MTTVQPQKVGEKLSCSASPTHDPASTSKKSKPTGEAKTKNQVSVTVWIKF